MRLPLGRRGEAWRDVRGVYLGGDDKKHSARRTSKDIYRPTSTHRSYKSWGPGRQSKKRRTTFSIIGISGLCAATI